MGALNTAGAPPVDLRSPAAADPADLARRLGAGEWVVDPRNRTAYLDSHLTGTVSLGLDGPMATWLGWMAPHGAPTTLLGEDRAQVAQVVAAATGTPTSCPRTPDSWPGCPVRASPTWPASCSAVPAPRIHPAEVVLDVRLGTEWDTSHVRGAVTARCRSCPTGSTTSRPGRCGCTAAAATAPPRLRRCSPARTVVVIDESYGDAEDAGSYSPTARQLGEAGQLDEGGVVILARLFGVVIIRAALGLLDAGRSNLAVPCWPVPPVHPGPHGASVAHGRISDDHRGGGCGAARTPPSGPPASHYRRRHRLRGPAGPRAALPPSCARRSPTSAVTTRLAALPASAWRYATIDPAGRYRRPQMHEDMTTLKAIDTKVRQIAVRNISHDQPTLLITNNLITTAKALFASYAERMIIENELDAYIGGFHLNALSSGIPLSVDLDTTLTVLTGNLYRLFAHTMPRYAAFTPDTSAATTPSSSTPASPTSTSPSPGGTAAPSASASHPADHPNHNSTLAPRIEANPVRDVGRIRGVGGRVEARSLSVDECARPLAGPARSKAAVRRDLPDLTRWFLGTGVRIGEAIAVGWDTIDIDRKPVEIDYKILRIKGEGLIRVQRTKSDAGHRTLPLPLFAVQMLERRLRASSGVGPLFPDAIDGWRDPSNLSRELREARSSGEFSWVTSHVFRKTCAMLLEVRGIASDATFDKINERLLPATSSFEDDHGLDWCTPLHAS